MQFGGLMFPIYKIDTSFTMTFKIKNRFLFTALKCLTHDFVIMWDK